MVGGRHPVKHRSHGEFAPSLGTFRQDTFGPLSDPDCSLGEDLGLVDGLPNTFLEGLASG